MIMNVEFEIVYNESVVAYIKEYSTIKIWNFVTIVHPVFI
jgi:hypothetical protein